VVEYCYFTQRDGDGEIISSKASQNIYRFNTFEDNTKAELVLRNGSENIDYGNFFNRGKGGVRVREGQDHYNYNNYFQGLNDRPIYLQNESSDPLDNINVAFNLMVDCEVVRFGGEAGSFRPTDVTFADNILTNPRRQRCFQGSYGRRNLDRQHHVRRPGLHPARNGPAGQRPPRLVTNEADLFGLGPNSPAINAAQPGFVPLP